MRKSLREIAQSLTIIRICFLGEEAQIISIFQKRRKLIMSLLQSPAAQGKVLNAPEAADAKRPFRRLPLITVKQTVACAEFLANCPISAAHAWRVSLFKAIPGNTQERCIQLIASQRAGIAL